MLETLLNNNNSGDEFEVIDLAETNLSMEGTRLRYTECLALQPDLVIFFTGNNWRTDLEVNLANDPANLYKLINEIKKHGRIAGIKDFVACTKAKGTIPHFLSSFAILMIRQS